MLASFAALSLGIWISAQIWPHWPESHEPPSSAGGAMPARVPAIVSAPAPVALASTLGTDASTSAKPLRLILIETKPAAALSESTAALGTDRRNPQVYAGGAVLSNGARIEEVAADHIVLSLRGQRTTLPVDPGRERSATPFEASAPAIVVGGVTKPVPVIHSSREDLSEFIRPQPVFENGRLAGLKILAGSGLTRLDALGIESGDVVRSIDGKPIDSNSDWQEIDDVLSAGGSITVGIERDGSLVSVSMDGARLAGSEPPT